MKSRYVFDKDNFNVRKRKPSAWYYIRKTVYFFLTTLVMAMLYYTVAASFFSTDAEKRLQTENRAYKNEYENLLAKEKLLAGSVGELQGRDEAIYGQIFHTTPPDMEIGAVRTFTEKYEKMSDDELIVTASSRLEHLMDAAFSIEEDFRSISRMLSDPGRSLPPMSLPLEEVSYAQVGASVGERINPFYQVGVRHNGLDIISDTGEEVLATGDGIVVKAVTSPRGEGNTVVIRHDGGYITRYKHLGEVRTVQGNRVKKGTVIGYVGVSGQTFAPHVHYEICRDTLVLDPINYIFASVEPREYLNMLVMSTSTQQSMD